MSRLTIALMLTLTATGANAQDARSGQSHTPASANVTQPFLFDGRMRGDGVRQRALSDDRHPNAGAIVVTPEVGQPERER